MVNNTHLLHLIRMLLEQSKWTHLNWSLIFFRRAPVFNNFRASGAISSALLRCSMIGLTPRVLASFKMPRSRFRSVGTAQRAVSGIPRYPSTSGSTKGASYKTRNGNDETKRNDGTKRNQKSRPHADTHTQRFRAGRLSFGLLYRLVFCINGYKTLQ